jgi:hypothetical protein
MHFAGKFGGVFRNSCGAPMGDRRNYAVWVQDTVTCPDCLAKNEAVRDGRAAITWEKGERNG